MDSECSVCQGARWVCEDHPGKPWDGASDATEACHCGGAGIPCPACNPSDRDNPPEMPEGYRPFLDSHRGMDSNHELDRFLKCRNLLILQSL
jgi:hypothetical protein